MKPFSPRTRLRRALIAPSFALATVALDSACGGASSSEDERGNVGWRGGTPLGYCLDSGHKYNTKTGTCEMPDGSVCPSLEFYNAECGQAFSFCAQQGGQTTSKPETQNGVKGVQVTCNLNGKTCDERKFDARLARVDRSTKPQSSVYLGADGFSRMKLSARVIGLRTSNRARDHSRARYGDAVVLKEPFGFAFHDDETT
jgi:putative hemolysin